MVKFLLNTHSRTDRQLALLLFAATFGLYLRTLAPGLLTGDAGEFQVAAWRLGLAHPTGYPLYLILGSIWQHLLALVGSSPAYALNMLSALLGATAVALLYLCMMHWLQSAFAVRRLAALFTAVCFATNFTFWSQNLIAEVYTLHALFLILIFSVTGQLYAVYANTPGEHLVTLSPLQGKSSQLVILLALLVGLSLTHHAMTVWLLPGLALFLWLTRRAWGERSVNWLWAAVALVAPLLLYLYIPLRSGAAASPWYHQLLGTETLTLYRNDWPAFLRFITGQSIAVGFRDGAGAFQQLGQVWLLWRLHFLWPGLVLAVLGLYVLIHQRRWSLLALTVPFFLLQQLFNLFYAIGDILVYYIPLYLIAAIWAGFAADAIGGGLQGLMHETATAEGATPRPVLPVGMALVLVLFWLPIQLATRDFARLDQRQATHANEMWQAIVAAQPPDNAMLVSNDRNEIVPLFYLQSVEKQLVGVTGLFPLIAPDARFTDIGATVATALTAGNGRPVYLIKPMPGLAVKFALVERTPPLVQVTGLAATATPTATTTANQPLGPLHLLSYGLHPTPVGLQITLIWQVQEYIPADYTTTVQLFDATGAKLGQHDAAPGGVYYPTSRWKPGDVLVERHPVMLTDKQPPAKLLVGMYLAADLLPLAPSLEIALPVTNVDSD